MENKVKLEKGDLCLFASEINKYRKGNMMCRKWGVFNMLYMPCSPPIRFSTNAAGASGDFVVPSQSMGVGNSKT